MNLTPVCVSAASENRCWTGENTFRLMDDGFKRLMGEMSKGGIVL